MHFGGTRKPSNFNSYSFRIRHVFSPKGTAETIYFEHGKGSRKTSWRTDTSKQWLDYPDFGEYERVRQLIFGQPWDVTDTHEQQ